VWPIAKKLNYSEHLDQIQPITLIDYLRKIFIKLFTQKSTKSLLKYDILAILAFANNVALLFTSTILPIQQLQHIQEDTRLNNKELWIILQDMFKAYNTVHLFFLKQVLECIKLFIAIINLLINFFTKRTN